MPNSLIHKIVQKVTVEYSRLSIVGDKDGLLLTDDVRYLLMQEEGLTVISGSALDLRVHYEVVYKHSSDERFIYVIKNVYDLLPDIRRNAFVTNLSISDLFPLLDHWALSHITQFDVLSSLFDNPAKRKLDAYDTGRLISSIEEDINRKRSSTKAYFQDLISNVQLDWSNAIKTITDISSVIIESSKAGQYSAIEDCISDINLHFQDWVDKSYFASLNCNPLLFPKSVNKILPHLNLNYGQQDKVALLVVDGIAYWQYLILESHMSKNGIVASNNVSLAWLPTITMLSRQAIFRGEVPVLEYHQSPESEKKLWFDFWQSHGFSSFEIQYVSDKDSFSIENGVKRFAYVTTEMDHKMHLSSDMRDLYSLTDNWSRRFVDLIASIKANGYTIFLTSDHGGTLSHGWRSLSSIEKAFLYKDGSRGKRHLIFNNEGERSKFSVNAQGVSIIEHDNWISIRDAKCFDNETQTMITHGGSHFMEMYVPLIKI